MKMQKGQKENKVTLIIAVVLLIGLLIFLLVYLAKGNNKPTNNLVTTTCILDSSDGVYEIDSEIIITSEKEKATNMKFNTVYTYTDNDLLMNFNYQEEKDKIDNLTDVQGVNVKIETDKNLGTITMYGDIDYKKIIVPNQLELLPPYDHYIKNPLDMKDIMDYLTKEGYKCE